VSGLGAQCGAPRDTHAKIAWRRGCLRIHIAKPIVKDADLVVLCVPCERHGLGLLRKCARYYLEAGKHGFYGLGYSRRIVIEHRFGRSCRGRPFYSCAAVGGRPNPRPPTQRVFAESVSIKPLVPAGARCPTPTPMPYFTVAQPCGTAMGPTRGNGRGKHHDLVACVTSHAPHLIALYDGRVAGDFAAA